MTTTTPAPLVQMVADLATGGVLSAPWQAAMLAVDRALFIPDLIWCHAGDELIPLYRADDPAEWSRRAYGPRYIVTQVDDGIPHGPGQRGRLATSSASRPDVVALMLTAAHITPGMRVLEIGTGTGYTAALLAHQLGAHNVTTLEVDPDLAGRARASLAAAGYGQVRVITGDGALGYRASAPYDRVLSTVAAPRVPYPWIAQTRPGGRILTPWSSAYKPAGLLSLTAQPDGSALGGFVNKTVSFMPLRDQREATTTLDDLVRDADQPQLTYTTLHARRVLAADAPYVIGWHVPDCHWHYQPTTADQWSVWFFDPRSRSWARFDYAPTKQRWPVHQCGPRRLWDEIHTAYHHWAHAGSPPLEDWQITLTPTGQLLDFAVQPQLPKRQPA